MIDRSDFQWNVAVDETTQVVRKDYIPGWVVDVTVDPLSADNDPVYTEYPECNVEQPLKWSLEKHTFDSNGDSVGS